MKTKHKTNKKSNSEEEIDSLVEAHANVDDAWDEPLQVKAKLPALLLLTELATRFESGRRKR